MNKAERMDRNMHVVLMRIRGVAVAEVAEKHNLTERQVRRIMAAWRKSEFRKDTEGAIEAVNLALETIKNDMTALGIASASAPPEAQVRIQAERINQLRRNFTVLLDAGVTFDGLFDGWAKDVDLVHEVNAATRAKLDEHGVDPKVINEAFDEGLEVFAKWGFPIPGP